MICRHPSACCSCCAARRSRGSRGCGGSAAWIDPALTTINQPLRDMAGAGARMLLDLAGGIETATTRIDLVTELVVRESTAPPP